MRSLTIPPDYQDAVIRAAITLKLCEYEETGGIVAALTTSIPEYQGTGRNWDYRFCWLRDSFFTVKALNGLGVTKTMEDYLEYVLNIAIGNPDGYMQPLFGLGHERVITEETCLDLAGYRQSGPVRRGNAAYTQVQNDGYGSVILAVSQCFFDQRLPRLGGVELFQRLEMLGHQAVERWNTPDAGLWEFRSRESIHTHSAMMCWGPATGWPASPRIWDRTTAQPTGRPRRPRSAKRSRPMAGTNACKAMSWRSAAMIWTQACC